MNQALPPIASDDFYDRYRQMCEMVLYGFAVMPSPQGRLAQAPDQVRQACVTGDAFDGDMTERPLFVRKH